MECDSGPRACSLCYGDRTEEDDYSDDDIRHCPTKRPLALASGYDALQDTEGRRVVITPNRTRLARASAREMRTLSQDSSDRATGGSSFF